MAMLESLAFAGSGLGAPIAEPISILRDIGEADLPLLAQEIRERNWSQPTTAPSLQRLRSGHHQLAQLLAADVSVVDASLITGRSPGNIYQLQQDPAFKELLAYYAEQQEGRDFDAYKRLVTLGGTALEILQERLEENPEKFTNNELRQLVESTMDRSAAPAKGDPRGAGNGQKGTNVTVQFIQAQARGPVVEVDSHDVKLIEEKAQ